jgi:hypothetical protein
MTITQTLLPEEAQYPASNFPQYLKNLGTNFPVSSLAFDATTDEAAYFKFVATAYGSGNLTLTIYWYADTATTGNVVWETQIAAVTPDTDTQDMETDGLATLNFVQDTHLGTTARRLHQAAITISNLDSLAANDVVHLRIARDANSTNATDDMANDALLLLATIAYSDT